MTEYHHLIDKFAQQSSQLEDETSTDDVPEKPATQGRRDYDTIPYHTIQYIAPGKISIPVFAPAAVEKPKAELADFGFNDETDTDADPSTKAIQGVNANNSTRTENAIL